MALKALKKDHSSRHVYGQLIHGVSSCHKLRGRPVAADWTSELAVGIFSPRMLPLAIPGASSMSVRYIPPLLVSVLQVRILTYESASGVRYPSAWLYAVRANVSNVYNDLGWQYLPLSLTSHFSSYYLILRSDIHRYEGYSVCFTHCLSENGKALVDKTPYSVCGS